MVPMTSYEGIKALEIFLGACQFSWPFSRLSLIFVHQGPQQSPQETSLPTTRKLKAFKKQMGIGYVLIVLGFRL